MISYLFFSHNIRNLFLKVRKRIINGCKTLCLFSFFFSLVLLKEISIKRIISMIEKHSDFFRNEKLVIIKYN